MIVHDSSVLPAVSLYLQLTSTNLGWDFKLTGSRELRSVPWQGNIGCHAPELGLEFPAVFDLSAQSSYELGSLAFRVLVGQLPYPMDVRTGVPDTSVALPSLPDHFPERFKVLMKRLVHPTPAERMTLEVALSELEDLSSHVCG